jgi:hypothetical protein
MTVANVNSVSDGIEGRVAGIGGGLCWNLSSLPVRGAGSSGRRWEIK